MAFNPFHAFRKHQKAFFAALTILCMVVFVLGGALGNFKEIGSFFGGSRTQGTELAALYGRPVSAPELNHVRLQREVVDLFIKNALRAAGFTAGHQVAEELKNANFEPQLKQLLSRILSERDMVQFGAGNPQTLFFYHQQMESVRRSLMATGKTKEADLAFKLENLLLQDVILLSRGKAWYFGGSNTAQDLIDFTIWRHQADRLGIQLSGEDVGKLLRQETQGNLSPDDYQRITDEIYRRHGGVLARGQLGVILADEFRVRMAQRTILGTETQDYAREPVSLTPHELWEFFREQRAESVIAMLPIPVSQPAFLDKVPEPTELDLNNFFEKNKDRLYDPTAPETGFKQPTRVQLEWVRAQPDSPHYQKATDLALAVTQATLPVAFEVALLKAYDNNKYFYPSPSWMKEQFLLYDSSIKRPSDAAAVVGRTLAGSGMQGPAVVSALVALKGAAASYELRDRLRVSAGLVGAGFGGSPWNVVAAAGAGQPVDAFLPFDQVKSHLVDSVRDKINQQMVASSLKALEDELQKLSQMKAEDHFKTSLAPSLLSQALSRASGPGVKLLSREGILLALLGQALASGSSSGMEWPARGMLEGPQDLLLQRHFSTMALGFALSATPGAVPLIDASLAVRGKPSDWSFLDKSLNAVDAQKVIARAVEKNHLEHGSMQQPRDRYHIGKDPGLEPLRQAFDRPWGVAHSIGTNTKLFAEKIFNRVQRTTLFAPERFAPQSFDNKEEFLYWKTRERPDFVPTFAEVKDLVKTQWKLEKARPLAREAAEKALAKLPKNTTGEDVKSALRDAVPELAGNLFELDHVARLVMEQRAMPGRAPQQYSPYQVPSSKIENSSASLQIKLLDMKTEGEAIIVHDRPEATYYVAVLVYRTTPYELKFFVEAKTPGNRNYLLAEYERDTKVRKKVLESYLVQLRDEADFKVVDQEGFRKFGRPEGGGGLEE